MHRNLVLFIGEFGTGALVRSNITAELGLAGVTWSGLSGVTTD